MPILRRTRGLVGIAVVWGVANSVIGTAFIVGGFAAGWISHPPVAGWTQWVTLAARVALRDFVLGGLTGAVFATLLAGAERHRNVDSLALSRVAGWGFLASAVPVGLVALLSGVRIPPVTFAAGTVASGLVGVGLGVGMVRVARRGSRMSPADSAMPIADGN
jgi:hypothetical protein